MKTRDFGDFEPSLKHFQAEVKHIVAAFLGDAPPGGGLMPQFRYTPLLGKLIEILLSLSLEGCLYKKQGGRWVEFGWPFFEWGKLTYWC